MRNLAISDSGSGSETIDIKSRYDVHISAYNFAKGFFEKCREARGSYDQAKEMKEKLAHLLIEMQNSMACFIFCTICLESYINTYAGDRLPDVVWGRLEKLRLQDKWVLAPQLVLGKTFEIDKEPYKSLKWLIDLRNFIVHYKGKFSELVYISRLGSRGDQVFEKFKLESSEKALQLVKDMIKTLHSFDGSQVPDWLV